MNEIDAWLACDDDGAQAVFVGNKPVSIRGTHVRADIGYYITETSGHAINPGECRPVKLKVEVVKDGN